MDANRNSTTPASHNHNEAWRKIETSLAIIQLYCDQLLSHYHQLSPQQAVELIEAIEVQNFLLQVMFANIAPSSQITDKGE